ncbi:MAG: hypothetical protein KC421_20860, partial [Anaerolineales bacterium]|nr:hypothetical protein [Anaerolineales bacterium]
TAGASNDLQKVTQIARLMVTQYGMSEDLGLRVYGAKQELVFLGREISEQRDYSDAIAEKIDKEVRGIIDQQHEQARNILTMHRDKLDIIAKALLDVETLEADEFIALMEGQPLPASNQKDNKPPTPSQPEENYNATTEWKPSSSLDLPPSPSPA